jgi:hypothetical protein
MLNPYNYVLSTLLLLHMLGTAYSDSSCCQVLWSIKTNPLTKEESTNYNSLKPKLGTQQLSLGSICSGFYAVHLSDTLH